MTYFRTTPVAAAFLHGQHIDRMHHRPVSALVYRITAKLQTMLLVAAVGAAPVFALTPEPIVKVLTAAEDATQKTVLIARFGRRHDYHL